MHKNQPIKKEFLDIIRRLVGLSYRYSGNKELFYKKFTDLVHIDELKRLRIIDPDTLESDNKNIDKLNPEELEVYCLMCYGFKAHEINVICRHKSINSTYVKQYRVRKKLGGAASPVIVLVMSVTCILIYLLVTVLNSIQPGFVSDFYHNISDCVCVVLNWVDNIFWA